MHHGMLTVYKEAGYTSSDAVARLRGILRMRKIGHTGTLDPDAEGVLPMCLGNATKICELIADRDKEYLAVMRLGVRTDTQDMSGTILTKMTEEEILAALRKTAADSGMPEIADSPEPSGERLIQVIGEAAAAFTGQIEQIPPMYSAVKVNGKRLYDMARKGITVERKARRITIHELEIEKTDFPYVTMRVRCSKGTYIRTLCEDIGNALGTGAAMQSLLRTRVGQFTLQEAKTLDELEKIAKTDPEKMQELIRPVDSFFAGFPAAVCSEDALRLLKNGNMLTSSQLRRLNKEEDPQAAWIRGSEDSGLGDPDHRSGDKSLCSEELPELPGTDPGDTVIRIYDNDLRFYGLYRCAAGRNRYTAFKMFLPQD